MGIEFDIVQFLLEQLQVYLLLGDKDIRQMHLLISLKPNQLRQLIQ